MQTTIVLSQEEELVQLMNLLFSNSELALSSYRVGPHLPVSAGETVCDDA
jgi:hypothetical protein